MHESRMGGAPVEEPVEAQKRGEGLAWRFLPVYTGRIGVVLEEIEAKEVLCLLGGVPNRPSPPEQ